jgi:hypothetical protein
MIYCEQNCLKSFDMIVDDIAVAYFEAKISKI